MNAAVALLIGVFVSTPPVVEQDGVRVEVLVRAQEYAFKVTNVDAPPIVRFEIDNYHTYNHLGPRGWTVELEENRLVCTADTPRRAIERGRSQAFTARVGSNSAALGVVDALVGFGPDHAPVGLEVWGPVRHPRSFIATIALTLAGIAVLHGLLVGRRLKPTRTV